MNTKQQGRLKKKGWSEAEVARAKKIMQNAERREHPEMSFSRHVLLWTMLVIGLAATTTMSVALFPIVITLSTWVIALIFTLIGSCLGALLVVALHNLQIHHKHHHHAMSLFVLAIVISITLVLAVLEQRYGGVANPLIIACMFTLGVIAPYQLNRGLHGYEQ